MNELCIFCKIIKGEIPADIIYQDDICVGFLDVHPVNMGHVLLVPRNHTDHLWNIEISTYHHLFDIAKTIQHMVALAYNPPRVGLVVEGFGVAHAHIHIIPVYAGNDLKKPTLSPTPQELFLSAQKIRGEL